MKRWKDHPLHVSLAVALVALAIDLYLWVHGSFEMFPSPEQEDQVRSIAALCALFLLAVAAALYWAIRRKRGELQNKPPHT
jgi:hypothetical protein